MSNRDPTEPFPLERGSPAASADPGSRVRPPWIFGLALAVFLADQWVPLGTGAGIAYVAVVLASLWAPRTRYTWTAAGLCTVLALVRLLDSHVPLTWELLSHRTLSILALWTTAILGVWQKRSIIGRIEARAEAARAQEVNTALKAALARTEAAEAQLRRGQRLLDTVAAMARIGGWEVDLATLEPIWSPEVYRIHGVDPSTRLDLPGMLEFYPPEARPLIESAIGAAIRQGASFDHTVPFITAAGERRWARVIGVPERTNEVTTRLSGAFQDVTHQHEIQIRLARASRSSSEGHWDYDFGTETVWCSATHEELLGLTARDTRLPAAEFRARAHPEDRARVAAAFAQHIRDGTAFDVQLRMDVAGRDWRWFRTRGAVERDELGRLASFAGSLIDIHEEQLAQVELRSVRARLERMTLGSTDGFFDFDVPAGRVWYSPRVHEMLGRGPEDPVTGLLSDIASPQDSERIGAAMRRHFEHDEPYDETMRVRARAGEWRWLRARGRSERDAAGSPIRFSGSIQDITLQREAQAALVAAKEAAAAANRAKSDFLANMSHEIRTPMNGVFGMTELLLDTPLEPAQREFAETIRTSATSLLGVLNDILDFSKIEAGKLEIEQVEMDVRRCVEDVGTMMAVQAAAKNLELIVNVDPAIPELVLGDPHRLRQILTNLAGNAVKFTQRGEIVLEALVVAQQAGRVLVHFEVRDSGAGMTGEAMTRLFQPFVQADASTTRHYGGTGLGLSIVKRLVELMGGQVGVASQPGKGSTFTFTLPCPLVEGIASPDASGPVSPQELRVLVVDDNETNQRVLRGQLRPAGYAIETVGSAEAALRELVASARDGNPFDLVIADDQLPDCDGAQLATRVRAMPELGNPQLVMLTSLDRHGNAERLQKVGFAGYLTKPVRGRELRACIERVLGRENGALASPGPRLVTRSSLEAGGAVGRFHGRVLVVEDNAVNQQVTRRFLERLGCEVEVAENGQRAVEYCARSRYDIILMDVQMPVMDGLTATREIRRQEPSDHRTPIIALTASAMTDELERCVAAGMDGLLTKPLEPLRLAETLDRHGLAAAGGAVLSPVPLAHAGGPAIDLTRLRIIVGDDDEFIEELCRTFLTSSGRLVEELQRALESDDRGLLGTLAHKLKGGSNSVCAQRVGDLAAVLERGAVSRTPAELAELVERIGSAVRECAGFIEAQVV
ncbi:MAG: response regulator [Steroidobacteraceae bacterium]